ncbi:MAG: putative secreted protein, partial [Bacteroidetes bacterium]|nr:putative secreted protein [Bacteroidota bacterium]
MYFCYHYLGLIHYENNNSSYSIMYYEKAIKKVRQYGDKNYLFNTYSEITWTYLKMKKYDIARQYIDTLNNFKNLSDVQKANIYQILSVYYELTNEPSKALEINKLIVKSNNNYTDLSRMLFKISKNYEALNKLDSALLYAEKAEECKLDSAYFLNNLYYQNIGEISEQLKLWKKSAFAYKKAYLLKEKATSKALDKQIMSLEKK